MHCRVKGVGEFNLEGKTISRYSGNFPTVKGYQRSDFRREGATTSWNPFSGSEGPDTDPEQVFRLVSPSPSCFFPFDPRVRVRLTSSRLSIFLGPLYPARNWFSFPHIRGLHRSLRGNQEEWGIRTDQFPDAYPGLWSVYNFAP